MNTPSSRQQRSDELLTSLVRIHSVNPMGKDYPHTEPVERKVIEHIEQLFAPHASSVTRRRLPSSPIHESLVLTLPGRADRRAALFESHMDTVPACGWQDRAFHPVVQSGDLIGLGSSDDKASLAAMVLALLEIVEESITPPRTIVLVCAADEEYTQTGIREFLRTTDKQFAYGIFGEPTQLNPVPQHKGIARWDITVHGRSAHSGCPELGVNAISGMIEVIRALQRRQEKLQSRPTCSLTSGTTITVTKIAGGQTRNAIPEQCAIAVDVRVSPGMDSAAERQTIMEELSALPWNISHSEPQLLSPPLNTDPQSSFSRDVLSICQQTIGNHARLQGMPYGTDAAWTAGLFPSIVLGPGDIRLAHAIDERIALTEVRQAIAIYKQIMLHPFAEYIEPNRFGSDGRT